MNTIIENLKMLPRYRSKNEELTYNERSYRRKTTEQYKEQLRNTNIEVLEEYVDAKTKIRHKCKICKYEWYACPNNVLSKKGCPSCKRQQLSLSKQMSHEQYLEKLKLKNIMVEPLEKYNGYKTKILHLYIKCGHSLMVSPASILQNHGCYECYNKTRGVENRKSHQDFINEIENINSSIKIIGAYVNSSTKIKCSCLVCENIWDILPTNLRKRCYCPKCNKKDRHKLHNDYVLELIKVNSNIIVLGDYIDAKTKILHKCTIHNVEWMICPSNALQGQGCSLCKSDKISSKLSITHEQYLRNLQVKNSNIEVLDTYINSNTKILHRYKQCGHEIMISPRDALLGFGCDKCNRKSIGEKFKHSQQKYEELVYKNNPNIKVLGKYISAIDPIDCECLICGHQWLPIAGLLSRSNSSGCPVCSLKKQSDKRRKTLDNYINEVLIINPYIDVIGDKYINNRTPIEHKCLSCNYQWFASPSNILKGSGCPVCSLSHGERKIMKILDSYKIIYESQKTFVGLVGLKNGLLSYDFYLPQYNVLIEFQGEQHEKPKGGIFGSEKQFIIQQKHDKRKRDYAKDHNINLLEIWYYDFDNIEEILMKKLNLNKECVTTAG